ncbi:hypothetical protein L0B53_13525 [Vibrio sp. SS-MA-C1-2]|uniref:hypothetical protein n=1 Tax=Vibrio sp. SS-MA-C1-2 TaxID=2908646 RepID=UPI001F1DE3CC|nr:hypothetical protein [Vibrio sp. SS-MA-C1-2]UJF18038.1 hypothetical protein L0B53_13525 [Vibrio sp. SS-MA-C1-2]
MKIILIIIVSIACTIGGMFFIQGKDGVIGQKFASMLDEQLPGRVDIHDVPLSIENLIIPINNGKRQSLLLLDLTLYMSPEDKEGINDNVPLIKNVIIKSMTTKDPSYFYNRDFIANVEVELDKILIEQPTKSRINRIILTKAIYQ